jgi:hypothetical protein
MILRNLTRAFRYPWAAPPSAVGGLGALFALRGGSATLGQHPYFDNQCDCEASPVDLVAPEDGLELTVEKDDDPNEVPEPGLTSLLALAAAGLVRGSRKRN